MRIIHLDEPTYLPPRWQERIAALGDFEVFTDRPDPRTAAARLSACDVAVVEWTPITAELLATVTRLRHLALVTTAFDFVDLDAASAAGITVTHCPAYSRQAVAEHVFGLLLALTRRLRAADEAVRAGASHLYHPFLGMELSGRTLGLIGTGRTAGAVARIAAGFGLEVIAAHRTGAPVPGFAIHPLDDVLRRSDVVSVHVPLNDSTRHLLSASRLALLRRSAVLINTCRGAVLDQVALAGMLATGRLAGAGLDDLAPAAADLIRKLPNVVLSPGSAWYTDRAREENLVELYGNLTSHLAGHPRNVLTAVS
jgi:glycerate dehydrogenase